jgi:hypothetical protein
LIEASPRTQLIEPYLLLFGNHTQTKEIVMFNFTSMATYAVWRRRLVQIHAGPLYILTKFYPFFYDVIGMKVHV